MKLHKLPRKRVFGFTLMETVIVLAVISILAAVGVPSLLRFSEAGRQTNRSNIARTLYLGAQNQLIELRITRKLEDVVGSLGFDKTTDVFDLLGSPEDPVDWQDWERDEGGDPTGARPVHFISKPAGYVSGDGHAGADLVWSLLSPVVINREILNDAILIEFNIETGVVLSVFYGELLVDGTEFVYEGDREDSVLGARGMAGYSPTARARRQGYYGVGDTSSLPEGFDPLWVEIYDGFDDKESPNFDDVKAKADLQYYELYDNGDWHYSASVFSPGNILPSNTQRFVINDGYCIELLSNSAGYTLMIGSGSDGIFTLEYYDISWNVKNSSGEVQQWPTPRGFDTAEGNAYRVYIPNSVMESQGMRNVSWAIYSGTEVDFSAATPIDSGAFDPGFAPAEHGLIRSPRHIENISYALSGSYMQQLNVDFALYCKELNADLTTANLATRLRYEDEKTAVVTGTFAGTYNGNARLILNLSINAPNAENVGLFAVNNGTISNVTLRFTDSATPGITGGNNTGAIAGTNSNIIRNCSVQHRVANTDDYIAHCPIVSGSSNVGGVVGLNSGTLTDLAVISTSAVPAVSGLSNVGGIVGSTTGSAVDRLMYLAVAPGTTGTVSIGKTATPIMTSVQAFAGSGNVGSNSHYLAGDKAIRPWQSYFAPTSLGSYNHLATNPAQAGNTLELVRRPCFQGWSVNTLTDATVTSQVNNIFPYPYPDGTVQPTALMWPIVDTMTNTMTATQYPYPFMDEIPPVDWPVATMPAERLAYYEIYDDGSMGFYPAQSGFTLDDYKPIVETGYCAIVPEAGGYSVDAGVNGANAHVNESSVHNGVHYVKLPASITSGSSRAVEIYVNDQQITDTGSRFINTMFAKAVFGNGSPNTFTIRTPQQMQNISRLASTADLTFNQEIDLDFSLLQLNNSVVTGLFSGKYNGGKNRILNLIINAPNTDNIGLFSHNSGTVKNIILQGDRDNPVSITGGTNVGGIAGHNMEDGVIKGCIVECAMYDEDSVITYEGIRIEALGDNVGGIAGLNEGTIKDCIFLKEGMSEAEGEDG